MSTLAQIKKATKKYYNDLYLNHGLFKQGSWLEKPEHEIERLAKKLTGIRDCKILDLGSGVGRNSIAMAQALFQENPQIICVDYLNIAIRKLNLYAKQFGVDQFITSRCLPVEEYKILKNNFDLIVAHGVLAELESKENW